MLNKVLLIGNVGKDAELRATPSGTQVLTFSLATSKSWTSNGEKKEKTEWHNIVFYGKTAATIQKWIPRNCTRLRTFCVLSFSSCFQYKALQSQPTQSKQLWAFRLDAQNRYSRVVVRECKIELLPQLRRSLFLS